MHNPNLVVMGSHGSTDLSATEEIGSIEAGLVAHKKNDGTVTVLSADGAAMGISLGETLDGDATKCTVARNGNMIPVQVTVEGAKIGNLTFLPKTSGVTVALVAGGTAGAEVVTVVGKAISVSIAAATSTATQIRTAILAKAEAMALLSDVVIDAGQGGTAQAAAGVTAIPQASYVGLGKVFRFSATTGKATSAGTVTGAKFVSDIKTGIKLDKSEVLVAYVDMGGGL